MPKIIFINRFFHPDLSATSQILTDLARDLSARGEEVCVVTGMQSYDDPSRIYARFEQVDGVQVIRIATSRFGRARLFGRLLDYLTFYLAAAWHLLRIVRSRDIVVAKTDPPLISVIAAAVSKVRGAILINWIQDLFPEVAQSLDVLRNPVIGRSLRCLRNASLTQARWNVVIGTQMGKRLIAEGVPAHMVREIPNWSDGEAIHPIERHANDLIDRWDLSARFVVGYSGNMGRAHEFGTLLGAAELLGRSSDIVFLLIGDGAQRPWIVRQIDQRGLKNVVLKPYQPKKLLSLSLSVPDIHLVSLHPDLEGLIVPSKFYGIAAAGRSTLYVGDKTGEIPQLLEAHGCGWTVALGESSQLASRIVELAANGAMVEAAGRNARQVFEANFDKRIAMQRWHSLLRETLEVGDRAVR
jgi:colanic acid biosynthesis glycosyl transferase WcaI